MRRTYCYAAMTKDEVQRSRWTFYEAVNFNPRNTQCIPMVKIFVFLDLEQN